MVQSRWVKCYLDAQLVQNTINPNDGLTISARCKAVIRGGKKPAVVEVMSNAADACGVAILIPTCA